jgi:hypothetical protein
VKKILAILLSLFFIQSANAALNDDDRYLYLRPLLGKLMIELNGGAFLAEKNQLKDVEILDVVAEQLAKNIEKSNSEVFLEFDTVNRLINVLGNSGFERYRPFLADLAKQALGDRTQRRLRIALDNPVTVKGEPFVPGKVDLSTARAALDKALAASRKDLVASEFTIADESTTSEVFKKFGYPDAISIGIGLKMLIGVDLIYYDRGNIRTRPYSGDVFKVHTIMPAIAHPPIDASKDTAPIAHRLMLDRPRYFLGAAYFVKDLPEPDRTVLDAAADRLWLSMNNSDGDISDGALLIFEAFKKSNAARYRPLLLDLAERSQLSRSVKKAAADIISGLGEPVAGEYKRRDVAH